MGRTLLLCLLGCALGCVDGASLRRGLQGEADPAEADPAEPDARAADAARPDGALADAAMDAAPRDADPADAAAEDAAVVDARPPDPDCVPETCNDLDDDCDGSVDEGVADCCMPGTRRDCGSEVGACTVGEQFCTIDLEWSPCSGDPPTAEVCNAADDDCDGAPDEGLRNACGDCGPLPDEACNERDDDCDGAVDEGVTNRCGTCGDLPAEACNERDDDCDGLVDEGVTNRCGACGDLPVEACNGRDDDCDDRVDEDVLNRCGECGPEPDEFCNQRDDDCDGRIDEGVLNACGACGPTPVEACNGVDDDCDGDIDEGVCYAYLLTSGSNVWQTPPGLNAHPIVQQALVDSIFTTVFRGNRMWAVVDRTVYEYDIDIDEWVNGPILNAFLFNVSESAYAVPGWWRRESVMPSVALSSGNRFAIYDFDIDRRRFNFVNDGSLLQAWEDDPDSPRAFPLQAGVLDLFDNRNFWPGNVAETCEGAEPGPVTAHLSAGRLYTADAGSCFRFIADDRVFDWAGFRLANAPAPQDIVAWAHLNPVNERGVHIVIVNRPAPARGP